MKIGIVTFHWSKNIGALLQAISLRDFIKKNSKNAQVNFESYFPEKLLNAENKKNFFSLNIIKFLKIKKKNLVLNYWKKNNNFTFTTQCINEFLKDFYIYGSDEIWNINNPFFGFDPYYFGNKNYKPKIAYAVSIGNLKSLEDSNNFFKETLLKFDDITVRDKNTFFFVKKFTNKNCHIVCDPTLLVDYNVYIDSTETINHSQNNNLIIYGSFFKKEDIQKIKKIAKKNNLKIISLSFYNKWADQNILDLDPFQFCKMFQSSSMIITSMFHGVILSYKFKKNFWFVEDPYRKNKLEYFLEKLSLFERRLDLFSDKDLNYKERSSKFEDWIEFSKNHLKNLLKNK